MTRAPINPATYTPPVTLPLDRVIGVTAWDEGDSYVVTINGGPIGPSLRRADAERVAAWLRDVRHEITQRVEARLTTGGR